MSNILVQPVYEGGTFLGQDFEFYDINEAGEEVPMSLVGADILIDFKTEEGALKASYKTSNNSLTVSGNTLTIPQHIPTLLAGKYFADINIKFDDELIEPGLAPMIWEILNPITKRTV